MAGNVLDESATLVFAEHLAPKVGHLNMFFLFCLLNNKCSNFKWKNVKIEDLSKVVFVGRIVTGHVSGDGVA